MNNNIERLDIKSTKQTFYANQTDFFKTSFGGGTTSSDGTQCSFISGRAILFQVDFTAFHKYSSIKSIKFRLTSTLASAGQYFDLRKEHSMCVSGSGNSVGVYSCNENGIFEIEILSDCDESQLSSDFFACLFLSDITIYTDSAAKTYRPQLIVEYIDDKESILNQKTVGGSVGRALNYNVNVRTGRPIFTKSLLNINTTVLPINLSLYFDPLKATEIDFYMPKGWRFNYQQRVIKNGEEYEYIDGSGLRHRFKTSYNNSDVFFDIAGTGLILTKSSSTFTIDNGYKQTLIFDRYGRLTKIIKTIGSNQYGLQFSYLSTFDNISTIHEYRKPSGATTETLTQKVTITYESSCTMKITSYGFPTITISSDSNNQMIRIMEEDSRVSTYTYDSASLLTSATFDNGEKTLFTYDACNRVKTINDYIVAKTEGVEDKLLSSMTFDYKYLSTHITNYFAVKKGYSFSDEGELIGEYEVDSNSKYVNINSLERTDEYVKMAANSSGNAAGYKDVSVDGDSGIAQTKVAEYSTDFSVGDFEPNASGTFKLSFVYKFTGIRSSGNNVETYIVIKQNNEELGRVVLNYSKYKDTIGSLIFKCNGTSALEVAVCHNYDARQIDVKNIRITQNDVIQNFNCTNYQTADEESDAFVIDSTNYYVLKSEKFKCSASSSVINKKIHYEDLVETQKNMAVNSVSFNLWYNKKRGLVANVSSANIFVRVNGIEQQVSVANLRLASVILTEKQQMVSYSDYSSSDAFRIDYSKATLEQNGETLNVTISQRLINSNYLTFKTIDNKGIVNYKTFNSYGFIASESLKNLTDSNYITSNYTYGSNLQLLTESTVINGITYMTNYETDYYTGRLKKITYPNGLVEEIEKVDGTIDKFKKLSATVNGVNSNTLSYNTRKDLIEKFQAHADGLLLTYDDYNMMKEFKNYNHVFWTKTRSMSTSSYSETTTISNDNDSFIRINSYDKYGNLFGVEEVNNGSHRTIVRFFYSDLDVDSITQASPIDSTLNKKNNSRLRKKIDNIIADTTKIYYNNKGNVTKETHTQSIYKPSEITYITDDFNRLTNRNYDISNGNTFVETFQYKNDYSEEVESYSAGVLHNPSTYDYTEAVVTYEEDNLGRVISEITTIGSAVFRKEYTYQGSGSKSNNLISTMVVKRNGVILETYNYTYDNMSRITNITNTSGTITNRYTYDLLGRLVREDNKEVNTTTLFEYDTNGNMLKKSVAGYTTNDTVTPDVSHSFTVSSDYADYITSYDGKAITTSSIGNITSISTTTYSWTRAKLLSQIKKSTTDYVNNSYDGEGFRIKKVYYKDGVTTTHTYIRDGRKILVEKINNGTTEKVLNYLYLGENVIGFVYNNAYYHFQKNLQNDIIAIYNESGIKVAAYEYDAWGNHTITLDTNSIGSLNPFRYRGYYYDVETGLFMVGHRYYNPEWGRWLSPDDIEYLNPQSINGLNLYAYCFNNPIKYVDYTGHFPVAIDIILTGFDHSLGLYKFILDQSIKGLSPKMISLDKAIKLARKGGHKQSARAIQRSIYNSTDDVIKTTKSLSKNVDDILTKFGKVVFVVDLAWTIGENISSGNEHWFTDSAFTIARNAIPFAAGMILTGGWGFFVPIGIAAAQGIVDYYFEDEINEFLDTIGDAWNNFCSFSWI